jgi:hypothetical protein
MDADERKKKLAERDKRLRDREINDIVSVLRLVAGRRLLWRLFTIAGIFRNPFAGDRSATDYNCGKQLVGQVFFGDITPEAFLQMQNEYKSEQESLKKEIPLEPDDLE